MKFLYSRNTRAMQQFDFRSFQNSLLVGVRKLNKEVKTKENKPI